MTKYYNVENARIEAITREKIRILRAVEWRDKTHDEYKSFLAKTKHKAEQETQRLLEIDKEIHNFVNTPQQLTPIKKVNPIRYNERAVERKYVEPYIFKRRGDSLLFQVVFLIVGNWIIRYLFDGK